MYIELDGFSINYKVGPEITILFDGVVVEFPHTYLIEGSCELVKEVREDAEETKNEYCR